MRNRGRAALQGPRSGGKRKRGLQPLFYFPSALKPAAPSSLRAAASFPSAATCMPPPRLREQMRGVLPIRKLPARDKQSVRQRLVLRRSALLDHQLGPPPRRKPPQVGQFIRSRPPAHRARYHPRPLPGREVPARGKVLRPTKAVLGARLHDMRRIHIPVNVSFDHPIHRDHAQPLDDPRIKEPRKACEKNQRALAHVSQNVPARTKLIWLILNARSRGTD